MAFGPLFHTDTGFTLLWQKHTRMHQNPPFETWWNPNIFLVGYTFPHPIPTHRLWLRWLDSCPTQATLYTS